MWPLVVCADWPGCSLTGLQTCGVTQLYSLLSSGLGLLSPWVLAGPTTLLPWVYQQVFAPWDFLVFPKMNGRGCHGAAASALRHPQSKK